MRVAAKISCFFLCCIAFVFTTEGQVTIFQKTYDASVLSDYGYSVQQCTDGGYVVAGITDFQTTPLYGDAYILRTDEEGNVLWSKSYGGDSTDVIVSIQQCTDGGFIAVGETKSFGQGEYDVYLIKTDENGDTVWTRTYGGTEWDTGFGVEQTTDGGYIVIGQTESFGAGIKNYYLIKTDDDGDTLWTKTYGEVGYNGSGRGIQQTSDDGYIMAGYGGLIKTDSNGNIQWAKNYQEQFNGFGMFVQSITQTADGGYAMTGYMPAGFNTSYLYVIRTDSIGDTLWTRTYGNSDGYVGFSIAETNDGGFIIAGDSGTFDMSDIYVVKIDAAGDIVWSKTYGGNGYEHGMFVQQTDDGGYVISGMSTSFGNGNYDVYLIKTDSLGNSGGCYEQDVVSIIGYPTTIITNEGIISGFGGITGNTGTVTSNPTTIDTMLCGNVGIEEWYDDVQIIVYPNPGDGKFTFKISNLAYRQAGDEHRMSNVEVLIYDMMGRQVGKLQLAPGKNEIDLTNQPDGIYFYRVAAGRQFATGKLIIH